MSKPAIADRPPAVETPATAIRARLVTITPQLAEKWLSKNTHNRNVVNSRVNQYAADMRRGEWRVNGETIKLAVDGTILDGQHRLMAVLEAGIEIQSLVISGLEAQAQETMDQGRARTLSDVFKLRGEKYWGPLATATRMLAIYELYGQLLQPPYEPTPSIQQAGRSLDRNPELRSSVAFVFGLRRSWMPSSHLGALHFLLASVDADAADDFVTKLSTGEDLQRGHAIYALREQLMQVHMERTPLGQRMQLALIVKAWNAYLAGDHVARLRWTPGGPQPEVFPTISGLATAGDGDDRNGPTAS